MDASADSACANETVLSEDEAALQSIEEIIWCNRTRSRKDPDYAAELRSEITDLFSLIWPHASSVASEDDLASLSADIDRIPDIELADLSAKLVDAAIRMPDEDDTKAAATSLLAGWLKSRAVELSGEETFRKAARQLRADHELLFARLLFKFRSAA